MRSAPPFAGGGPAEALAAMARHLRLRLDPRALAERIRSHSHPRSLLALVEVAPEFGLMARAFRADLSGIQGAALPVIVHLHHEAAKEDSFALLLERGEGGYALEDPLTRERQDFPPLQFEALWTGVLVTVSRGEEGAARAGPAGVAARLRARLREVGASGPGAARWAGAVLLVALALAGAARAGDVRAVGGVLLDLVGASVGLALFLASRRSSIPSAMPRLSSALCGRGTLTDCESVLSSRFARIAGIELAVVGLGFFASSLVMAAGSLALDEGRALHAWLAAAHVAAVPAALTLIALQVWPLKRLCPLCMTVHAVVLASAALGAPLVGPPAFGLDPRFAGLHALCFLGVVGLVVPFFEAGMENRVLRKWLEWASATPWGALAAVAGQPAAAGFRGAAGVVLGAGGGPFRVDGFVHPLCPLCPPVIERLRDIVGRFPGTLEVHLHLPPRDPRRRADRELCAAVTAVGLAAGPERLLSALETVKLDARRWLESAERGAEHALSDLAPGEAAAAEAVARAREAVGEADRMNAALRRGVPSLLLNGRLWDAPLADLEALLSRHRSALAEALGVSADGRAGSGAGR